MDIKLKCKETKRPNSKYHYQVIDTNTNTLISQTYSNEKFVAVVLDSHKPIYCKTIEQAKIYKQKYNIDFAVLQPAYSAGFCYYKTLSMKETFLKLAQTATKIVVPTFYPHHRYYIFRQNYQGQECIVLSTIKKGSYWNLGGSSWFYFHSALTGEFIESFNGGVKVPANKERLLKADLQLIEKIHSDAKKAAA